MHRQFHRLLSSSKMFNKQAILSNPFTYHTYIRSSTKLKFELGSTIPVNKEISSKSFTNTKLPWIS